MYINLLIFTQIIYFAVAKIYNDGVFDQSEPNSSQHIWHSYKFNTGAGNREELYLSSIGLNSNFESASGIFVWKTLPIQEQIVIVGLGENILMVTTLDGKDNSYTYKKEIQGFAKGLALFQKWNVKTQEIESFAVVATHTTDVNYMLKWYQFINGGLKFLWDWPFHGNIIHLDVIKINYESKLLIVNDKGSSQKNPSAEIYSFDISQGLDIWLFEKIALDGFPSSVSVFENNDNIFFSASFPSLDLVHIFKYTKSLCLDTLEKKHFVSHQKIFSNGLKSLKTFRVGFRWYLAVASQTSRIYYIRENLLFEPISSLKLGSFNDWLSVPVDTYREDGILLASSVTDVSVITWTGDEELEALGSLTRFACEGDGNCTEKMKGIALNESTAFEFNGHQNIILSNGNGTPLFLKLVIKLKPLPDKVTLKLKDILNMKESLEKNYYDQIEEISQLLTGKEEQSKIGSISFPSETFEAKEAPKSVSQTKNPSEILTDVNRLKETTEHLENNVNDFLTDLKTNILPLDSNALLNNNTTQGITFHGDVLISELNLSNLNGRDVSEMFADTFRRDRGSKIGGRKTLKNLRTENVIFEKLGDTLACDIVFSDDPWEERSKNVINGDIKWQGKLNILNDVLTTSETTYPSRSSSKTQRGTPKHVYDTLNLEELVVTEDIHIQKTINGQPFILPVHGVELNILDVVNQARIENVNVKQTLQVGFINGRNFTKLIQDTEVKPQHGQREFDKIKIEGSFSAPVVEAIQVNGINLSREGNSEFDGGIGHKLLEGDPNYYVVEESMRNAQSRNSRRVIHVFQNLEVDGILFAKTLNNISWSFLNDTVKKDERMVTLPGMKTFEKSLTSKWTKLNGTLNNRFAEHILTDFSDQIIRFRQIFDVVSFKNLSLKGTWDGVDVNEFNKSVVRFSYENGRNADFIFEEDCFVNVLNVTDSVNDVNVKGGGVGGRIFNGKIEVKSIKAANVNLHGSLVSNNNINNVNLTDFSLLRVSLKSPETVNQDLLHRNVTVFGDLNLETVNLNDVSSIINSGGDTGLIENFLNGEIGRIKKLLVKGNITAPRGINGFNVSKIVEKGISITKPGSMKGNVTFENIIYFDNINVTGSINGFSLKELEKDIAFHHSRVFLNGAKNFTTIRVNKSMRARSLNGHLVQDILSLKGDHGLKGPVRVNGNVTVRGNLTSYSAINRVTVTDLLRSFSTKYDSFIYSGDLRLENEHVTIGNLVVGGKIQNISLEDLMSDVVMKDESFIVSGKKTFKGEVRFKENVAVKGSSHGVDLSKIYSEFVFTNKPTKLKGRVVIKEAVLKVLETTGDFNSTLINNFNTNEWLEDSILLDRYDVVSGKKIFEDVQVMGDVSADFINSHLPTAMIPLKTKQYIPSLALFPRIHTTSDLSVSGTVNGRNLMKEYEDTVLKFGDQTISGRTVFDKKFVVDGNLFVDTLKGKPVNDLITLDTEQVIKTPLEIKGLVTAKKDVEKLRIINNISLSDWNRNSVLLDREQVLNGLWTVKGKVKAQSVEGEGLLHAVSLPNVSKDVRRGRVLALEMKNATEMEYSEQRRKVEKLSKEFSEFPYLFYQFEVADEIETSFLIESVITFKIGEANHLIITFVNECMSMLYKWNKTTGSFDYVRQINIGSVSKWSIIYRNQATYLITTSLRSSKICEENPNSGQVWVFKGDSEKYTHLLGTNAFVDITHENDTSEDFFTIDERGVLQQWILEKSGNLSSKFLLNIGPVVYTRSERVNKALNIPCKILQQVVVLEDRMLGIEGLFRPPSPEVETLVKSCARTNLSVYNPTCSCKKMLSRFVEIEMCDLPATLTDKAGNYRFIDFRVMGGLAISDGREIKQITLTDDKVIENNIAFLNAHIVPLAIEGKTLIAVVVKDKILVYENIFDDKIYSVIHTYRAGSVLWFNYGPEKQAFLIVASHHKLIEVYEYKSVSGLVKIMSIQMYSSRLQSESLPSNGKYQFDKYLIVVQKKKVVFVKADMLGDFYKTDSSS